MKFIKKTTNGEEIYQDYEGYFCKCANGKIVASGFFTAEDAENNQKIKATKI